jgi:signal transduction histidine kinase
MSYHYHLTPISFNRLAFICMNVEKLDEKQVRSQKLKEANEQLEFMSQTIDDFRNFYAPSKEKESFSLAEESQNIIDFINYKNIDIALTVKEDHQVVNYKNEFKQVLLNLLNNAKDVLEERNIIEPKISILIDKNMLSIKDNAGGIKLDNIEQIFDPYFSTKEQGLGIGLYISKIIIEKNMGGKLSVQNFDDGVEFRVLL